MPNPISKCGSICEPVNAPVNNNPFGRLGRIIQNIFGQQRGNIQQNNQPPEHSPRYREMLDRLSGEIARNEENNN